MSVWLNEDVCEGCSEYKSDWMVGHSLIFYEAFTNSVWVAQKKPQKTPKHQQKEPPPPVHHQKETKVKLKHSLIQPAFIPQGAQPLFAHVPPLFIYIVVEGTL